MCLQGGQECNQTPHCSVLTWTGHQPKSMFTLTPSIIIHEVNTSFIHSIFNLCRSLTQHGDFCSLPSSSLRLQLLRLFSCFHSSCNTVRQSALWRCEKFHRCLWKYNQEECEVSAATRFLFCSKICILGFQEVGEENSWWRAFENTGKIHSGTWKKKKLSGTLDVWLLWSKAGLWQNGVVSEGLYTQVAQWKK